MKRMSWATTKETILTADTVRVCIGIDKILCAAYVDPTNSERLLFSALLQEDRRIVCAVSKANNETAKCEKEKIHSLVSLNSYINTFFISLVECIYQNF